jgi:hypothetical protein
MISANICASRVDIEPLNYVAPQQIVHRRPVKTARKQENAFAAMQHFRLRSPRRTSPVQAQFHGPRALAAGGMNDRSLSSRFATAIRRTQVSILFTAAGFVKSDFPSGTAGNSG